VKNNTGGTIMLTSQVAAGEEVDRAAVHELAMAAQKWEASGLAELSHRTELSR
jgi:hypothetical protein